MFTVSKFNLSGRNDNFGILLSNPMSYHIPGDVGEVIHHCDPLIRPHLIKKCVTTWESYKTAN